MASVPPNSGKNPAGGVDERAAFNFSLADTLIKPVAPELVDREEELDIGNLAPDRFYAQVLKILSTASDLGVDPAARARIYTLTEKTERLPQLICRDLLHERVLDKIQLARAAARVNHRREIMSYLDLPPEALGLRHDLEDKVNRVLRDARVIPLALKEANGKKHLHLAHEGSNRDVMLESTLGDIMPNTSFSWHFTLREVAGAYWLSGAGEGDIDANMEAEALLDRLIATAIDARASDIHIDPSIKGEPRALVKYRIDGFVQPKEAITVEQLERLKVRIENLARMAKVHQSHPNKGAFSRAGYDWRVQMQPHAGRQGTVPRIVIRRLRPDVMPLEVVGYPKYFIEQILEAASAPNGVIFWTGPTGSGKTESIHAAVVSVNPMAKGLSVHTIEDPPEKRVPGYAVQMEVASEDPMRTGMELLKSSLRADPDVVIFGEVRDTEMAKLVFEAANTGHLVFTTLHTNSALDAVIRLDEMGIYGFLISYIRGIAAQRLVRRLCTHCRIAQEKPDDYIKFVFDKYGVELDGATLFNANPEGCASCNFTGYYGRIAIAEWLRPSKELVAAGLKRDYKNIHDIAVRAGWKPMGYMGVLHVRSGITDVKELSSKVLELSGNII